jgi:hypothetical protein
MSLRAVVSSVVRRATTVRARAGSIEDTIPKSGCRFSEKIMLKSIRYSGTAIRRKGITL